MLRGAKTARGTFQIKAGPVHEFFRIRSVTQTTFLIVEKVMSSIPIPLTSRAALFFFWVARVLRLASVVMAFMSVVTQWRRKHTHTHRRYALMYVSLPLHTYANIFTLVLKRHTKTLRHTYTHLQPDCWTSLI